MKLSLVARLKSYIQAAEEWYLGTPERALDQAYEAALRIKRIEDEHFGGKNIPLETDSRNNVSNYFQVQLKKNLRMARMRLTEFKASNFFIDISKSQSTSRSITTIEPPGQEYTEGYTLDAERFTSELEENQLINILNKLEFIDSIIAKYQPGVAPIQTIDSREEISAPSAPTNSKRNNNSARTFNSLSPDPGAYDSDMASDDLTSSSYIPRSILRTANRFRKELDPDLGTEEALIKDFRNSRARTRTAIKFVLLLVILPLLTQQISKNFIFSPLIDHFRVIEQIEEVIVNPAIEEKIIGELSIFEEKLKFESLISQAPIAQEEINSRLKVRARELAAEFKWEVTEPVKNVLADSLSLGVFAILIAFGKQQIAVLKSFIDEVVYGLSDSAKAFIIILFTDVFVGFHSPHGWEVIVENTLQHFGLPENQDFINMFIATFPVMLDTVFKYWIFRYLNQISPSAVATYRNMNE